MELGASADVLRELIGRGDKVIVSQIWKSLKVRTYVLFGIEASY